MEMPPPDYCLLWIDHWSTCMPRSEWPGWVQAVGSVFALLLGVWVVRVQARLARQLDAERDAEKVRSLARLLHAAADAAESWLRQWTREEGLPDSDALHRSMRRYMAAHMLFKSLTVDQIMNQVAVNALLEARELISDLGERITPSYFELPPDWDPKIVERWVAELKHVARTAETEARRIEGAPDGWLLRLATRLARQRATPTGIPARTAPPAPVSTAAASDAADAALMPQ